VSICDGSLSTEECSVTSHLQLVLQAFNLLGV
jgi:hypothetical protein